MSPHSESATAAPAVGDVAATDSSNRSIWSGRITILIAIILSAFVLRIAVTSTTPLLDVMGRDLGFGATITGIFGMLPTAAFAIFGILAPAMARRIGLERLAMIAMLMSGAGLLARGLVGSTGGVIIFNLLALGGMGIGNVVVPPLVKRYFPDRVGAMSTAYITALQFGTILPALIAVPLANATSWQFSLAAWCVAGFAAVVPWIGVQLIERRANARIAKQRRGSIVESVDEAPELAHAPAGGAVWKTALGWGMAAMFGMTSLVTYSMFTWIPKILGEAGASAGFGGTMVALFSALGLCAALGLPSVVVRMRNPFPIVLGCVLAYAIGFTGLLIAPMGLPVLWVALIGLGPSTFPMSLTMINLRTRTPAGSAALSGFTQGVGYAAACVGPLLLGVLRDATGGWGLPFALLGVAIAVMAVGAWFACRPTYLEDVWR
ncbi:CP family cyanate transporter-like MFS transporter [Antricoccus suffuscus]|uniref:CP family cyanate transporter-like MFS transporter n=1 Tax=Antricoccus suffuscus TaxID=1629062 RepID=A0A2T0YZA7_9ACTN|nr:CP family cyanate transporter-like MFS transporter [Antricoccus suffuscus]